MDVTQSLKDSFFVIKDIFIDLKINHLENLMRKYFWQEYDSECNWRDFDSCTNPNFLIDIGTLVTYILHKRKVFPSQFVM